MRFRSHLIELAKEEGDHPRNLHAAIVAQGKRILGESTNYAWQHAETNALREAFNRNDLDTLRGCTLYTLMVRAKSGKLGNGSPCPSCMDAIRAAGIRKVVVYI
jgi:tRNA(Arg) A34 adenosine deaminase TadA